MQCFKTLRKGINILLLFDVRTQQYGLCVCGRYSCSFYCCCCLFHSRERENINIYVSAYICKSFVFAPLSLASTQNFHLKNVESEEKKQQTKTTRESLGSVWYVLYFWRFYLLSVSSNFDTIGVLFSQDRIAQQQQLKNTIPK